METENAILKHIWKCERLQTAKVILSRKRIAGRIIAPVFKLCYRTTVPKIAWYWYINRHTDQWKRIDNSEINPHSYIYLTFDIRAKNIHWRTVSLFNKWCWEN
jgi:hypothetical protein